MDAKTNEKEILQNESEKQLLANIEGAGLSTGNYGVKQTIGNSVSALVYDSRFKGNIKYNLFTKKIDIVGGTYWKRSGVEITDNDFNNILLYLEQNYSLTNKEKIFSALDIVAHQNEYHPIRESLLKFTYQGDGFIENLFPKYLGVEKSEYCTEVTKIFMLGAIERVFNPGCKFDTMLCIVGGQGLGKSTMFRFLSIKDEWFTDDLKKINDEKCYEKIMGHWIIEMSEMLAVKSAKSIEDLKSFITRQSDIYRIPYNKFTMTEKRQCVFCGTSNNYDFMPDDRTGNRRFIPLVASGQPEKHPLENEIETRTFINNAWAEAMKLHQSGKYKTILSDGLNEYIKTLQRDLMPEDTRVGVIQEWLDNYTGDRVCSLMIYREAFDNPYGQPDKKEIATINGIMNHQIEGWEKSTVFRFKNGYGTQRSWQRKCQQECKQDFKPIDEECLQEEFPF